MMFLKKLLKKKELWFAVGEYKKRANVVGGRETSKPADVHKADGYAGNTIRNRNM